MPRGEITTVQNKLIRGLITEATGLNFPEDAVTDSLNVKYDPVGYVERRLGFDLEGDAETLAYEDSDGVIKEFVWTAVAGSGKYTFLVLQKGSSVHFFKLAEAGNVSSAIMPVSVNLNDYKAAGASLVKESPASFASGQGYLYIAHPKCDPVLVRWNPDTSEFETSRITILIRDFEGVEDQLDTASEPTTLSTLHHYNLRNQGWHTNVRVGATSNEIGEGGPLSSYALPQLAWAPLT
jgi:hypothetical protein